MDLAERVHAELIAARKTAEGLTPLTIADCPTICVLLGAGDPAIAYNEMKLALLDLGRSKAMDAAIASLGFSSDAPSHLGRLEAFGADYHYDQRQARRYSDKGVQRLATLISSRWAARGVPTLDLTVIAPSETAREIQVVGRHHVLIEMRPILARMRVGDLETAANNELVASLEEHWQVIHTASPVEVLLGEKAVSVSIVWPGELWPKFGVTIGPGASCLSVETLGAKAMIRF